MEMTTAHKIALLESYGFTIGARDERLNTAHAGSQMVVEATYDDIGDYQLPTADGANGPWCIVGDDVAELVDEAYDFLIDLEPPTLDEAIAAIQVDESELPARKFTSLHAPAAAPGL